MATIAPPPSEQKPEAPSHGGNGGFDEGGFQGDGGRGGGGGARFPDRRYYTGIFVALASITMFFAALTSAYVVRRGLGEDWTSTALPAILWLNTVVLIASSLTLEKARHCLEDHTRFRRWWTITSVLGGVFLIGQLLAWQELVNQGVYLNSNPASSFFYLITGTHGLHLLGGVLALVYLFRRIRSHDLSVSGGTAVGVTAIYWHFMDGLWIYLFLLLLLWG